MDVSTDNHVKRIKLVSDKNRTCTDDMTIKVKLSRGRETPGKGREGGKGSRGWMEGTCFTNIVNVHGNGSNPSTTKTSNPCQIR